MKKKFYTWQECMQLREVQVCIPLPPPITGVGAAALSNRHRLCTCSR